MSKPLLLHVLSLNDRMLESNQLPLHGRVWAYAKEDCLRDGFVGHCLTMLAQLGMTASGISLGKKDILAFDAEGRGRTYTVVISMADDSLASRHYYFLGIWQRMDVFGKAKALPDLDESLDVLKDDFNYEVYFSDTPLQADVYGELIEGDALGQDIYEGQFSLVTSDPMAEGVTASFVLSPLVMGSVLPRAEVRHALYSLRNLMALKTRALHLYQALWDSEDEVSLYREAMVLMRKVRQKAVRPDDWDRMVCENGESLLRIAEQEARRGRQKREVRQLEALFESILGELGSTERHGMHPVWSRMSLPFIHLRKLFGERAGMLARTDRQCETILQLLHSRMLARQQRILAGIEEVIKKN